MSQRSTEHPGAAPRCTRNTIALSSRSYRWGVIAVGGVLLLLDLYAIAIWHAFPARRTDVGGDYAYVAWQVSRGAVLYRDVLGQQTPLLYLIGALSYRLWPWPEVFLALALVMRGATVIGVFALARASGMSVALALVSAVTYLLLPMGFLFDARFEPNGLITLGGVLCALALTRLSPRRVLMAGCACGLFILAKLTFAPLALALAGYLLLTRRSLIGPFVSALCAVLIGGTALGWASSGQDFIRGAFLAHVGSTYALSNFTVSLRYILVVEGLTVLTAVAGAALSARKGNGERLLAFYLLGGLATLGATMSVGSLAPEMLAGEPAVALCAGLVIGRAMAVWRRPQSTRRAGAFILPVIAAAFVVGQTMEARDDVVALSGRISPQLACVVSLLSRAKPANAPVLAPPYAAFLAQRTLVDGLSDTFNWSIRVRRGDDTALAQVRDMAKLLESRKVALVVMDADQPLPQPVARAMAEYYRPIQACPGTRTLLPRGKPED